MSSGDIVEGVSRFSMRGVDTLPWVWYRVDSYRKGWARKEGRRREGVKYLKAKVVGSR